MMYIVSLINHSSLKKCAITFVSSISATCISLQSINQAIITGTKGGEYEKVSLCDNDVIFQ